MPERKRELLAKASIDKTAIASSFGHAAKSYDSAAHFQRWVGDTLLSKAESVQYKCALDLGTGTGYFLKGLAEQFGVEHLFAFDLSEGMVRHAAELYSGQASFGVGDAECLPFKGESFDLIFSSLAIQWCFDLPKLFAEIRRVLKPGGRFVFSTLLDGSLHELKRAWSIADNAQHVNEFFTLEDYNAVLKQCGYKLHFLDQQPKVLEYKGALALTRELKDLGAHNMTAQRQKGLTGKTRLKSFIDGYEQFRMANGLLPATYEIGFASIEKPL